MMLFLFLLFVEHIVCRKEHFEVEGGGGRRKEEESDKVKE